MIARTPALWLAVLSLVPAACSSSAAPPGLPRDTSASLQNVPAGSISKAYAFLDVMMDKYATGSTTRLVRSFDGGGVGNFTDAVTYDDALMVDALLGRGTGDDLTRAHVIGDAFLYVQRYDAARDGRLRAAYAPKPLLDPSDVVATDKTSDTGNMAWVGQALVQLYAKTSDAKYLNGAVAIADWLKVNTADTRGAGGYTGGDYPSGTKIEWKSTEHNIDIYAFFTMLARETGDAEWNVRAASAQNFIASMWNAQEGRFYVGTANDGKTPNKSFKPEDVNSWSYLAFQNANWAGSIDWDVRNLNVHSGGFSGVSFCSGDRSGVWFEGTSHLAAALELRNAGGDGAKAATYLDDVFYAQKNGPHGDGTGIIAASKNRLSDCDGDYYYQSLHVGATAWYILAVEKANPFELL